MADEQTSAADAREPADDAEAAVWYDTHDTTGLDTEEVPVERPRPGLTTVAVRLAPGEVAELQRRAKRLGVGYTTYVRMLINRHVLEEKPLG